MVKLEKKKLEKKLGRKFLSNTRVIAFDPASRTGWATIDSTTDDIILDFGYIDTQKVKDPDFRYKTLINAFDELLTGSKKVVIEDVFFGKNVNVLKLLSRIGMIVYVLAHLKGIDNKYFILATQSRKVLGLQGNAKKEVVHQQLIKKLGIKFSDDPDITDAIVLCMGGALEEIELCQS